MNAAFEWGFRLAFVLPPVTVAVCALALLLVPAGRRAGQPTAVDIHKQAA